MKKILSMFIMLSMINAWGVKYIGLEITDRLKKATNFIKNKCAKENIKVREGEKGEVKTYRILCIADDAEIEHIELKNRFNYMFGSFLFDSIEIRYKGAHIYYLDGKNLSNMKNDQQKAVTQFREFIINFFK